MFIRCDARFQPSTVPKVRDGIPLKVPLSFKFSPSGNSPHPHRRRHQHHFSGVIILPTQALHLEGPITKNTLALFDPSTMGNLIMTTVFCKPKQILSSTAVISRIWMPIGESNLVPSGSRASDDQIPIVCGVAEFPKKRPGNNDYTRKYGNYMHRHVRLPDIPYQ